MRDRKMTGKRDWISLIIGFIGSMLGLIVLNVFNRNILMLLPLPARMITMIITYWLVALASIILMTAHKEKLSEYGFTAEKLENQIIVGVLIAAAMSLALTVVPHLLGFGEYVSSEKNYTRLWQFIYEFIYCIFAVGFAEEFVFRGYIYKKILDISGRETAAVIASSVLFGLFHIFRGSIVQVIMTAFIGAFFCLCRAKLKGCTIISLVIAHGIYDALITVWTAVL